MQALKWLITIALISMLSNAAEAAPKKSKNTGTKKTDTSWSKEYFAGVEGEVEKTTATGDSITVEATVRTQITMHDLLNNIRNVSVPGSFTADRSAVDANGKFSISASSVLDSDRFANASDFNKLFNKAQIEMAYLFTCNKTSKACRYEINHANNADLNQLEGKPGELENLADKGIDAVLVADDFMRFAIEGNGKFESLFYFKYGSGELNPKGIAFLKKHFPKSPILYKGTVHFASETGWEPKDTAPVPQKPKPRRTTKNESGELPLQSGQNWQGYYVCAQGKTDLTLKIGDVFNTTDSGVFDVNAVFDFRSGRCVGQFNLSGQYSATTQKLVFAPGKWINNPCRYGAVGMDGSISNDNSQFSGKIPECNEFNVKLKK